MDNMDVKRGLVQVYTGDGEEKSAAALGQAMRAAGHEVRTRGSSPSPK